METDNSNNESRTTQFERSVRCILIVRRMQELGLTASEFILLTYLLAFAENGEPVCASLRQAQKETGLAPGTIHHAKSGLVTKGFIRILNVRNKMRTNTYDLTPLQDKLDFNIDKQQI